MEWICFEELTGLEKAGIVSAVVLGIILLVIGIILLFRRGTSKERAQGQYDKVSVTLPIPLACVVLGVAIIGVASWWLWKSFPVNNLSFSQKPWTLGEIKERLERTSNVRLELKGDATSFTLDRNVSGACASDLLASICKFYPSKLQCDHPKSGTFIIAVRP